MAASEICGELMDATLRGIAARASLKMIKRTWDYPARLGYQKMAYSLVLGGCPYQ